MKFSCVSFFLTLTITVCFLSVSTSMAQDDTDKAIPVLPDFLADKTWWDREKADRYYFGNDQTFVQQFFDKTGEFTAGTSLTGRWRYDNNILCWRYDTYTPETDYCHVIAYDAQAKKEWGKYDDTLALYGKTAEGVYSTPAFTWNRWMDGNLILNDAVAARLPETLTETFQKTNQRYEAEGSSAFYPFNADITLPPTIENYVSDITTQIMELPLGARLYHRADGRVFSLPSGFKVEDPSKLDDLRFLAQNKISFRHWFVTEDGLYCAITTPTAEQAKCLIVLDGDSLQTPQDGYVQVMDDRFIRRIKLSYL